MSQQTAAQLSQRLHELFSQGKHADVVAMADDEIETVAYALGMQVKGKDAFRTFVMSFADAFPDIRITPKNVVASGDLVCIEFDAFGTNTGSMMTPDGPVPPTGREVTFHVCEVHEWQNGKLVRLVNYQDSASIMRQLGLLPEPAGL
ncbi:MAG: ester cyclase [Caldilineaceae bacterium]|nr:ester cyclase [Caldilineaceae bacterium]